MNTIQITCRFCDSIVERNLSHYRIDLRKGQKNWFCSRPCVIKYSSVERNCQQCNKKVRRPKSVTTKFKHSFCSNSCAATYNNTHKTKGTRRSKLEKYLEEELTLLFPNLEILFNCKDVINSELDIYIPKFRLAIELNGIYHFKPIHGEKKLKEIQNNDSRKIEVCNKQLITLVSINTSIQKKWNSGSSKDFLNTIKELLDSYLLIQH